MNFHFHGATLVPDLSGALMWEETRSLIVADLHFEKGSSFAARGQLLPPYDTAATLGRLLAVIERVKPKRVICLGDSFHDDRAADRLHPDDIALLRGLTAGVEWLWVVGNHDPAPPEVFGGTVVHDFCLGPLTFRHIAAAGAAAGEISGHYHPKAAVATRGKPVTRPCFVGDGRRLILPAFGAFTGGLNVRDPAILALLAPDFEVVMLGQAKLHRFPSHQLKSQAGLTADFYGMNRRRQGARLKMN
jgi:DNA ligase-associated metallophosphoesterase